MDPIMVYEQASEIITREIQKRVDKGNIDKETLCLIGEAIDIQKDLESLKMLQNENNNNSYDDRSYNNYSNRYRRSYDNGYDNSWEPSNSRMRSNNGMSGHGAKDIVYKLEDAMNMAEDRQTREAIRMALEKIEKM